MTALRTTVEGAIQTALSPLLYSNGGYLKALEPYGGEFLGVTTPDDFRHALGGRVPAVLYYAGQGNYRIIDLRHRRATLDLQIHLLVASGTYRSLTARTRGGHAEDQDPGIFQVLEDIRERLFGVQLNVDGMGMFEPRAEEQRVMAPDLTIWEQQYTVNVESFSPDPDEEDLESIRANVRVPDDVGEIAAGEGDDLTYDADTDVVTLTDADATFDAAMVGLTLVLDGSTSEANDGRFAITAVPTATTLEFTNPNGVTETFDGTWRVLAAPAATLDVTTEES